MNSQGKDTGKFTPASHMMLCKVSVVNFQFRISVVNLLPRSLSSKAGDLCTTDTDPLPGLRRHCSSCRSQGPNKVTMSREETNTAAKKRHRVGQDITQIHLYHCPSLSLAHLLLWRICFYIERGHAGVFLPLLPDPGFRRFWCFSGCTPA